MGRWKPQRGFKHAGDDIVGCGTRDLDNKHKFITQIYFLLKILSHIKHYREKKFNTTQQTHKTIKKKRFSNHNLVQILSEYDFLLSLDIEIQCLP